MHSMTIRDITHGPDFDIDPVWINHLIYLVRDGDTVFYIGQSHSIFDRLMSHMGLDWRSMPTSLGTCIRNNAPASDNWIVEIYTLEDARPFVDARCKALNLDIQLPDHADLAEEAMIAHFRPCLNTAKNPCPKPLPEKYINLMPTSTSATALRGQPPAPGRKQQRKLSV